MDGNGKRLLLVLSVLVSSAATPLAVGQSLNGQSVTVTLQESGFSDVVDTVTAGPGPAQIIGNTLTDPIGSILFSNESVDLQNLQIAYKIQGGGGVYTGPAPQCSGSPGCTLWSASADDARFLFSGLNFGVPGDILSNVSLTTTDVFGVTVADITPTSFEVIFGSAGVLNGINGNPALGQISLSLTTELAPVPEPSTYLLMLGGLGGLLVMTRRRYRGAAGLI